MDGGELDVVIVNKTYTYSDTFANCISTTHLRSIYCKDRLGSSAAKSDRSNLL
jgi:hypothetical protein